MVIKLLTEKFYENFADEVAAKLSCSPDYVEVLYELAANPPKMDRSTEKVVMFRSAYVLNRICFDYPHLFEPYSERFFDDFPHCRNESAKRHFGRIMAHLLKSHTPTASQAELIAESAAAWLANPKAKVAVKLWAMEVLIALRERVEWLDEMWDDIIAVAIKHPTPAIESRMRNKWRQ